MPIIQFTASDKMAAVTAEAGWNTMVISNIDGPKQSQSGKSINFFVDFKLQGGKYDGKELTILFNTESSKPSILSGLQVMPHSMLLTVKSAIDKIPLKDVPERFDTDELLQKPFDGKVEVASSDGGLMNTISQFAPAGTGVNAVAPF